MQEPLLFHRGDLVDIFTTAYVPICSAIVIREEFKIIFIRRVHGSAKLPMFNEGATAILRGCTPDFQSFEVIAEVVFSARDTLKLYVRNQVLHTSRHDSHRFRLTAKGSASTNHSTFDVDFVNISMHGAFLKCAVEFNIGDVFALRIPNEGVQVVARVVRKGEAGEYGVIFDTTDTRLKKLLKKLYDNPIPLEVKQ